MVSTVGIHTKYFQSDATSVSIARTSAQNNNVTITNISVKEVGEGWSSSDGNIDTFNANGVTIKSINTDQFNRLFQSSVSEAGKYYKVTYTIHATSFTTGTRLEYYDGVFYKALPDQGVGTHTFIYIRQGTNNNWYFNLDAQPSGSLTDFVTISSVSVQQMVLTKIFPEIAPPDIDPPYIVYSVVSNQPSNTKNENGEIDEASLEVYSFQDTYNKTVDLGVAVRASLDRVNGTFATVKVDSINYTNEQMDVNESRKLWAAIQDYTVRIKNI